MYLFVVLGCVGSQTVGSVGGGGAIACSNEEVTLSASWHGTLDTSGCGYRIDAIDPERTVHLVFDAPAFVDASQGQSVDVTYTLPDDTLNFEVETGCQLVAGSCDEDLDPVVEQIWTPVSGSVHLTCEPDRDRSLATVVFSGVVFEGEAGDSAHLDATWNVGLSMGE